MTSLGCWQKYLPSSSALMLGGIFKSQCHLCDDTVLDWLASMWCFYLLSTGKTLSRSSFSVDISMTGRSLSAGDAPTHIFAQACQTYVGSFLWEQCIEVEILAGCWSTSSGSGDQSLDRMLHWYLWRKVSVMAWWAQQHCWPSASPKCRGLGENNGVCAWRALLPAGRPSSRWFSMASVSLKYGYKNPSWNSMDTGSSSSCHSLQWVDWLHGIVQP